MGITINGKDVLEITITEDRIGAWTANVEADSEDPITGSVTLDVEGETFVGTVWQGDVDSGRWKGMIVGGAGGTQKIVDGNYYVQPTARTVMQDLASASGETLSPDISPALLFKQLERWTRLQGFAHTAFRQLADELGVEWRITRAGQLWFGTETWETVTVKSVEGEYSPEHRMLEVAYEDNENDRPVLRPGITYDGQKVQRVVTNASAKGLRQYLFFDDERGSTGLLNTIRRVIREMVWPKLQLARVHTGRVIEQAGDGSVTIVLDDPAIGGKSKGLSKLPLVLGLPGTTVRVPTGAKLRLMWDAGNPTKPRAAHFDQGTAADEIALHVGTMLKLGDKDAESMVALADLVDARFDVLNAAIATAATNETGASGLGGMAFLQAALAAPPSAIPWSTSTAAEKVKAQ
jgi:hypothetical protein